VKFSGIMMQVVVRVMLFGVVSLMRELVGHHMWVFLTMVLEMWRVLVLIVVAVIDEGVGLLEVIRWLLADPVCVVRECTNSTIFEVVLTLKHEFHDVSVLHTDSIINLMTINIKISKGK
jgi:hypothetical protein